MATRKRVVCCMDLLIASYPHTFNNLILLYKNNALRNKLLQNLADRFFLSWMEMDDVIVDIDLELFIIENFIVDLSYIV